MRSLRGFLLRRLVGGAALILGLGTLVAYLLSASSALASFDRNLTDRVQAFAAMLWQIEDEVELQFSGQLMPEYERAERPAYFQVHFAEGALLERSESLAGGDLEIPAALTPVGTDPVHWSAPLPDGRPGRYVSQRLEIHHVYPEEGPGRPEVRHVRVTLARGVEALAAARLRMLATCLLVGALLLALIAGLAWTTVGRALAPAGRLASALQAARVERRPERLEVEGLPSELVPMAETADELIRQVGVALERERRTTADIAHELRTPISELLTASEVALRHPDDPRLVRRTLSTVREVAWRMGRSVATLLKLARLDAGSETFADEPVDLGSLVNELLFTREPLARERELEVDALVAPGFEVRGDPSVLRIVLSNLVSNAVHHAPRGSRVTCSAEAGGDRWTLVVENAAPSLEPRDLASLAEPFWRKDGSRADRQRTGLGLALSRRLAERCNLALDFRLEQGRLQARLSGAHRARAQSPVGSAGS